MGVKTTWPYINIYVLAPLLRSLTSAEQTQSSMKQS